jgi:hypothetical protein
MKDKVIRTDSGRLIPYNTPEEVTPTVSKSVLLDPEYLLPEIINNDNAIIDENWCDTVRDLIQKQPTTLTRHDWMDICLGLVNVVETMAKRQPSIIVTTERVVTPEREFRNECQIIFDERPGQVRAEPATIPFEVGLQLLKGAEMEVGEHMHMDLEELKREAMEAGAAMIEREEQIKLMQQRITHWKTLARMRLEEMRRDMEFRNRLAFRGDGQCESLSPRRTKLEMAGVRRKRRAKCAIENSQADMAA